MISCSLQTPSLPGPAFEEPTTPEPLPLLLPLSLPLSLPDEVPGSVYE